MALEQELRAAVCCSAMACAGDEALEGAQVESLLVAPLCALPCGASGCCLAARRVSHACSPAGRVPPLDARVLLAGDHTVWDPGGGEAGAELWAHLRLLFGGSGFFLRAIRLDWLRVSADLAGTAPTLPSCCVIHKRFDIQCGAGRVNQALVS